MISAFSRSPLRISFAGGGTDIPEYSSLYSGCVLSTTIARFAYTKIESSVGLKGSLCSSDQGLEVGFENITELNEAGVLPLHRAALNYFITEENCNFEPLKITTFCESPIGAGLGASSTVTVSLLQALAKFYGKQFSSHQLAEIAFEVERNRCKLRGGKQDQFAAAYGGLNFFKFKKDGSVEAEKANINQRFLDELQAQLVLCYSGKSRLSGTIIQDQRNAIGGDKESVINSLHEIRNSAEEMLVHFLNENMDGFREVFIRNWVNKVQTSPHIMTPEISKIINGALSNGATAGKVSGAGGGGFLLFLVSIEKRGDLIRFLKSANLEIYSCSFFEQGSVAW